MNILDYLTTYQDRSFKEYPFNELDAAILSMLSYFPFEKIDNIEKYKVINNKTIFDFIDKYEPEKNITEIKLNHINLMVAVLNSKRFKGIKFTSFKRKRSNDDIEQFQAITIELKQFTFVSFSGTDSSVVGWREDFNMAFLDIVPSEVDAISYINQIRKRHPFKKMYIGGHSKGGRLAIRATKEIYKKNRLVGVYSFDGPNFTSEFYDEAYTKIKPIIFEYAPNESVIGRLISDLHNKIIVDSKASLLFQHDLYTWEISDNQFVRKDVYTDRSNKIAAIFNDIFLKYNKDVMSVFVNSLFDLLDRLNITELKDAEYNKQLFVTALSSLRNEWKAIPKENRKVISDILFTVIKLFIKRR